MGLAAGTSLGPYEILSSLGAGGMGEVYRARDPKLGREIALKILPELFATDPERLARFRREAQILASLNHPNIAQIYGVEDSDGIHALVMELVEGSTLADRIAQGPLPVDEGVSVARQIAEALEAAHEQGIVHRDLKPANIKVRSDGAIKVLDFGLAKLLEAGSAAAAPPIAYRPGLTNSPTLTTPAMTMAGVILGTAAYMSPEQARGKQVDRRADIWAFGVVLFEMLTGVRPFEGETVSDILARVIEREPEWVRLPVSAPQPVVRLLRQCLKKDPRARLRDIGDARVQLEQVLSGAVDDAFPAASDVAISRIAVSKRRQLAVAITALIAGGLVAGLATWVVTGASLRRTRQTVRFAIVPSPPLPAGNIQVAVSPDGKSLVYVSLASPGGTQLMLRGIDQLNAVPLTGTLNARVPFFSADGQWVGFFTDRELKKVSVAGGPVTTICRFAGSPRGASWASDDTIVFATADQSTGLLRVAAAGGEPTTLTTPDDSHGEADHIYPSVLPGARAVLFTILAKGNNDDRQIAVMDLTTGKRRVVLRRGTSPAYVDSGYVMYADAGTLMAVAFDPNRLELRGAPVAVVEHVLTVLGNPTFSASANGTLVYVPGGIGVAGAAAPRSLAWVDRQGREEPLRLPVRTYTYPRLSPDGTKVALDIRDQENDIWVADLSRQTLTRLTFDPANDFYPVWTPDGRYIIFNSNRGGGGDIFRQRADGTGQIERLTTTLAGTAPHYPYSMSRDGRTLIYQNNDTKSGIDLDLLVFETVSGSVGGKQQSKPLIHSPASETNAEISPNGRWLAYQANERGSEEVYVRPFPDVDSGLWQISTGGGTRPVWSRAGTELLYLDVNGYLTSVPVQITGSFAFGRPTRLLNTRYFSGFGGSGQAVAGRTFDVSPDGKRFLVIKDVPGDQSAAPQIVVIVNESEELGARVSVK